MLCVLLSAMFMLGLCACDENAEQTPEEPTKPQPPELIYGTWYPKPDVSEVPVQINKDGTCIVNGQQWTWVTKSVEEDTVFLTVGEGEEEFEIEFKYLTSSVPVLGDKYFGWSVKDGSLWDFTGTWYNEETKDSFVLTLFALKEAGCEITLKAGTLIVQTKDGYTLNITQKKCVVTDTQGNNTTYIQTDWEI